MFPVRVPANMPHTFQRLDLTVHGYFKQYIKEKFSTWYSQQISLALKNGEKLENINISFKITVLKPLYARCFVKFCNHTTSGEKTEIITHGFKRAGIPHALELGSSNLPELHSLAEFSTLIVAMNQQLNKCQMKNIYNHLQTKEQIQMIQTGERILLEMYFKMFQIDFHGNKMKSS